MTRGDGAVLLVVIIAAALLFYLMPKWVLSKGTDVVILAGDRVVGNFTLKKDRVVEVPGPLGVTVVRIQGGRARIESSPCPHKICVRMGDIGSDGGVLVCIPNEVVVKVTGDRTDGLDAVSR